MMNDDICRYTKRLCMYKLRVEKGGGLVAGTDPGVKACDSCAARPRGRFVCVCITPSLSRDSYDDTGISSILQ
jgi:hypothetical protein